MRHKCVAVKTTGEFVVFDTDDIKKFGEYLEDTVIDDWACFALFRDGKVTVASSNPAISPDRLMKGSI